jgi:cephalosporin hydroxylase
VKSLVRALRFPRKYTAALTAAYRLRRRTDDLDRAVEESARTGWYGDAITATQAPEEITWLLHLLREQRPRTVVEIGTDQGGTLYLWPLVAARDAVIAAIDTRVLGPLHRWSPYAVVRRALRRGRQRIVLMMPADSHDPATVERLRRVLGERSIDFLFIDGDHSYDGVRSDFELFSPLVRAGGIIAFHDIDDGVSIGVKQFWGELKQTYPTDERVASGGRRFGIGVLWMPGP